MPCPCQLCPAGDATVHLTELHVDGTRAEVHLCRACVARLELHLDAAPPSVASLLEQRAKVPEPAPVVVCPACGLEFSAYAQSNLFGCAVCYDTFAGEIDGLAQRYHGTSQHVGRSPAAPHADDAPQKTAPKRSRAPSRATTRRTLQTQLAEAVNNEQFERAAALRDQLSALDAEG